MISVKQKNVPTSPSGYQDILVNFVHAEQIDHLKDRPIQTLIERNIHQLVDSTVSPLLRMTQWHLIFFVSNLTESKVMLVL